MSKLNVILIAGLLALAAILGTVAASRTVSLGASARHTTAATVQSRTRQLDAFEASLHRALARKPPALPAVPKATASAAAAPRVVYHRPPPIVVVKHTHHGDDGGHENEGGGDD